MLDGGWVDRSNITPEEWMGDAACATVDPEMFFPKQRDYQGTITAVRFCVEKCPVLTLCGEWALRTDTGYGIAGGMTAEQRANLRK